MNIEMNIETNCDDRGNVIHCKYSDGYEWWKDYYDNYRVMRFRNSNGKDYKVHTRETCKMLRENKKVKTKKSEFKWVELSPGDRGYFPNHGRIFRLNNLSPKFIKDNNGIERDPTSLVEKQYYVDFNKVKI